MKKEILITIPEDWSSITLKKYLELQNDLKNYGDDEEAVNVVLLHHLCDLDIKYISQLSVEAYEQIIESLSKFINRTDYELQKFITIGGVEYGFEPNLSNMSYGAYIDITKYDNITIDENWAKIMSILYRPVVNKSMGNYETKNYDGNIDDKKFLDVAMDIHFGTLFFFYNLLGDLVKNIQKSLKELELPPNIKSILERNGKVIPQLLNLQTAIY